MRSGDGTWDKAPGISGLEVSQQVNTETTHKETTTPYNFQGVGVGRWRS